MARFRITISGKGLRRETIKKLTDEFAKKYGDGASVSVEDATPPTSRADRFSAVQSLIGDARAECEEIKDELEQWKDNLPDNLQDSEKAQQLDDAISELDTIVSNLEDAEGASVEFPGMMG